MSGSDPSYLDWLLEHYGPEGGGSKTWSHARQLYREYGAGLPPRPPCDFVGAGVRTFADHDRRAKELQRLLRDSTGGEAGHQPGGFPSSGIIFKEGGENKT